MQHYFDAWHKAFFLSSLRNSAIIVGSTVIIAIIVAFFAAVARGSGQTADRVVAVEPEWRISLVSLID